MKLKFKIFFAQTAVFLSALISCHNTTAPLANDLSPDSVSSPILVQEIHINENAYSWTTDYNPHNSIANRIVPPQGFERQETPKSSFGEWLRFLPLKEGNPKVKLYNGSLKGNQSAHYAVLDIDVGSKDLQQCADAVIRLRSEFLFAQSLYSAIHFKFTSGHTASWEEWSKGKRPVISGNKVSWTLKESADTSYANFREYLNTVFMYAGTSSLEKELQKIPYEEINIGEVLIKGGFPGHAAIVVDAAINKRTGEKIYLLAQSYMPAQEMHILKNPLNPSLSPWYSLQAGQEEIITPEWTFLNDQCRRFY